MADEDYLLHRQVNPAWVQQGRLASLVFLPMPKDEGLLSVYDGSLIDPERSFIHYTNRAEDVFSKHGYSGEPLRTLQFRQDTSVNEARWTFVGGATMRVDFLNRNMSPPSIITHYTEDLRYKIPVGTAARVSARALWGTWLYSEEAVAWMFPIWLALAASGSLATG